MALQARLDTPGKEVRGAGELQDRHCLGLGSRLCSLVALEGGQHHEREDNGEGRARDAEDAVQPRGLVDEVVLAKGAANREHRRGGDRAGRNDNRAQDDQAQRDTPSTGSAYKQAGLSRTRTS